MSVLDAVRQAAAEVQLSGGSFKLLQQSLAASADSSSNSSDRSTIYCSPAVDVAGAAATPADVVSPVMVDSVICHELIFSDAESEDDTAAEDSHASVLGIKTVDAIAVDMGKHSSRLITSIRVSADGSMKLSEGSDLGSASDIDADVMVDSGSDNVISKGTPV